MGTIEANTIKYNIMEKEKKIYKYLEVVRNSDHKAVKRFNVTDKSERSIERVERGLLLNMNTDDYHTNIYEHNEPMEDI